MLDAFVVRGLCLGFGKSCNRTGGGSVTSCPWRDLRPVPVLYPTNVHSRLLWLVTMAWDGVFLPASVADTQLVAMLFVLFFFSQAFLKLAMAFWFSERFDPTKRIRIECLERPPQPETKSPQSESLGAFSACSPLRST